MNTRYVTVEVPGGRRVKLYRAGGVGYEYLVPGIGWVVDDESPDDQPLDELIGRIRAAVGEYLTATA